MRNHHIEVDLDTQHPHLLFGCGKPFEAGKDSYTFLYTILTRPDTINRITCERCLELLPLYEIQACDDSYTR